MQIHERSPLTGRPVEFTYNQLEVALADWHDGLLDAGHGMVAAFRVMAAAQPIAVAAVDDVFLTHLVTTEMVHLATPVCCHCEKPGTVAVTLDQAVAYQGGALAQEALSDLTADEREQVMSGIHPTCWSDMFGVEETDVPPVVGFTA